MTKLSKLLGIALVAVVAFSGFAAAAGTFGVTAVDTQATTNGNGPGVGDGTGPINVSEEDRALNGSNSPWVTDDERLDIFQDRYNLTDEQVMEIQNEVQSLVQEGADRDEIRRTVTDKLETFGVDDPSLGPPADGGQAAGPFGPGNGTGDGSGNGNGYGGPNAGNGPHGPADGSCLN